MFTHFYKTLNDPIKCIVIIVVYNQLRFKARGSVILYQYIFISVK